MMNNETMNNETMVDAGIAVVSHDDIPSINPMELANPTSTAMYCTVQGTDQKSKVAVFNAVNSPDEKLADHIGETINLKDVIAHSIDLVDDVTGEVIQALRVVLIDDKGKSYEAVSGGVANALNRIMQIFGQPETWEKPLKVKAVQKSTRNGNNKVTTLKVEE